MTQANEATRKTDPSPDDVLVAASSHEHLAINRYRLLSLRFLPFSVALSRLFEALAGESELRLQALMESAGQLGLLDELPAEAPREALSDGERRHFFITGEEAAAEAMGGMLAAERAAHAFYVGLHRTNALPALDGLLVEAIEQTRLQALLLEESGGQLLKGTPLTGQGRSAA